MAFGIGWRGKDPAREGLGFQVRAHDRFQPGRADDGAVLGALAAPHPDREVVQVNIAPPQTAHLAQPHAGGVTQLDHDAHVRPFTGGRDQPLDLGGCPDDRQAFGQFGDGDLEPANRPFQEFVVETAQAEDDGVDAVPAVALLLGEEVQIMLDLAVVEAVGTAVVMVGKVVDGADVLGDRGARIVTDFEESGRILSIFIAGNHGRQSSLPAMLVYFPTA